MTPVRGYARLDAVAESPRRPKRRYRWRLPTWTEGVAVGLGLAALAAIRHALTAGARP